MRLHEMEEEKKTFVRAGLTRKYRKHSLTTALKKKKIRFDYQGC